MSSMAMIGNMDEWMREQERRITSVERRKRRLSGVTTVSDEAGRDAIVNPTLGMLVYREDTGFTEQWNGTEWQVVLGDTGWVPITDFAAGFAQYTTYSCDVRRIGQQCMARGLIYRTSGTWAASTVYNPVLTFPAGFRPPILGNLQWLMMPFNLQGIDPAVGVLSPTGVLQVRTGVTVQAAGYVSLSALRWTVD